MSNLQMPASAAASAPAPPFTGFVRTTLDALLILEAARRGIIPRITRRLVEEERKMIGSGSVFVFDEDESGIKRWTDGCFWSPSRILGNFLIYRETERKASATKRQRGRRPNGGSEDEDEDVKGGGERFSRPRDADSDIGLRPEKVKERSLLGSLTNSSKFKMDGLMKKTFSLTINGITQHLISYYRVSDIQAGRLRCPSTLPELASLSISPEYLDVTHFRNPPKIEVDSDGVPHYRGEADESLDDAMSPSLRPNQQAPLFTQDPLSHTSPKLESQSPPDGSGYDTDPIQLGEPTNRPAPGRQRHLSDLADVASWEVPVSRRVKRTLSVSSPESPLDQKKPRVIKPSSNGSGGGPMMMSGEARRKNPYPPARSTGARTPVPSPPSVYHTPPPAPPTIPSIPAPVASYSQHQSNYHGHPTSPPLPARTPTGSAVGYGSPTYGNGGFNHYPSTQYAYYAHPSSTGSSGGVESSSPVTAYAQPAPGPQYGYSHPSGGSGGSYYSAYHYHHPQAQGS